MDSTHIHLLLNHFPILGTLIGTLLLLFGVAKNNTGIQQVSLFTIIVMAIIAIPVFLTGEPAEESVENLPGVIKSLIEDHEEAAEIAFWAMIATGVSALISLILQFTQNKLSKSLIMVSLLLGITTAALMGRTGYLGGQIRHTEIRGNAGTGTINIQGGEENDD